MADEPSRHFRRIARAGCGDVNLCITINNNVGGGPTVDVAPTGTGSGTFTPDILPPGALTPPTPPDPTLPMPWLRGSTTTSDPTVAMLYMKGLVPHEDQGADLPSGPYEGSGDISKQSRYRVNSSSVTTSAPYGDSSVININRVSVFMTAEIDASGELYKGFACARADSSSSSSITMVTDMTTVGTGSTAKNHVYATHDVTTTAPALTLSVTTPTASSTTIACTVGGTVPSGTLYIVIMPERVLEPGTGPTFSGYKAEGAIHSFSGSGTYNVSRPTKGWAAGKIYFAFVVSGDPASASVLSTPISKPSKFTVGT